MANAEVSESLPDQRPAEESVNTAGLSFMSVVMAMVVSVLVAVGLISGMIVWLAKSGRLPLTPVAAKVVLINKPEKLATKLVVLEPLLVNLTDDGGRAYLRIAMTLRVEEPPPNKDDKKGKEGAEKAKAVNENEAAMRDAALGVLGRESGEALLGTEGKQRLKNELDQAMKTRLPEVKVSDIFFTEFLVQR